MGAKKIKGSRKVFELPIETQTLSERFRSWAEANSRPIFGVAVVMFVVLMGIWGFEAYQGKKEKQARTDYALLTENFPQEDAAGIQEWEKLIPSLEKYIQEHGGTAPALDAQMDLALVYFKMGRYEETLKWANKALQEAPSGSGLRPLIRYRLAVAHEMLGKTDEAIAQWSALKSEGQSGSSREIDWHLGLLYGKKGDYAKGIEHYQAALNASGAYPNEALLKEELASLKLKAGKGAEGSKSEAAKENS